VDILHVTHLDLAPRFPRLVVTTWDPLLGPVARMRAAGGRGEDPISEGLYALVDAWACFRSAAIIAPTTSVERAVRRFPRPVEVIPPFLPVRDARTSVPRTSDVVMIANGLDNPRKGLQLALEAVEIVRKSRPGVRLVLIGSWSDPDRAAMLPDFCDVAGPLSHDEVLDRIGRFGCCIVPSLWEEFGYVALEALDAGVPVACSPGLGISSVSGGGVFAAEARTPPALSQQLLQALDAQAISFPSECRAETALGQIISLYERVLKGVR
jgi:glycosyltransferase involved in cell wall biosynthesis